MRPFFLPCSLQLSALTDLLFSQLWITGAFINAKSGQAVHHGDMWLEENPVIVLEVMVTLLLRQSFPCTETYLLLFFFLPASNVSRLLPLNCSVNFQKPVKYQHSSLLGPRGVKGQGVTSIQTTSGHASSNSNQFIIIIIIILTRLHSPQQTKLNLSPVLTSFYLTSIISVFQ